MSDAQRLILVSNRLPVSIERKKGELSFKMQRGRRRHRPWRLPRDAREPLGRLGRHPRQGDRREVDRGGAAAAARGARLRAGLPHRSRRARLLLRLLQPHALAALPPLHPVRRVRRRHVGLLRRGQPQVLRRGAWRSHGPATSSGCRTTSSCCCPGCSASGCPRPPSASSSTSRSRASRSSACCPWREQLLEGLLGSDLIGFHTYDYVRYFLSSVRRLLGRRRAARPRQRDDRLVLVDAFPMGIDYDRYAEGVALTGCRRGSRDHP